MKCYSILVATGLLLASIGLSACGQQTPVNPDTQLVESGENIQEDLQQHSITTDTQSVETEQKEEVDTQQPLDTELVQTEEGEETEHLQGNSLEARTKNEEQSFEVNLEPLGIVNFVSYKPDFTIGKSADALFSIWKDGQIWQVLEGMEEGELRSDVVFQAIQAVSFGAFDGDNFDDILVICSYTPIANPSDYTYSEARIYNGQENGYFQLNREHKINSAVVDITVDSVKRFLGIPTKAEEESDEE